jgi:hypothetical protein
MEQFHSLFEEIGQWSLAAEDESCFIQSSGQHTNPILFQEPGMLEAASTRAVQYDHLGPQIT